MKEAIVKNSRWMEAKGPEADIVLSSRVRIARNIEGEPFPCLAPGPRNRDVLQRMLGLADAINELAGLKQLKMASLSDLEKQVLVEKHLISPGLARGCEHGAALVSDDEAFCIMVNEEDHLRIQAILPGLQLEEALAEANRFDDALEEKISFAFDDSYGYMTACPTNLGTGLRASVMMHLPALVKTNQLSRFLGTLARVGLTVRGLYGEGTDITGNLVQVSNQVTLGLSEEEIIANLHSVTFRVIEQEQSARQSLLDKDRAALADSAWRAYGLLERAQIMGAGEAIGLISALRLGCDLGLIKSVDHRLLNELLVIIRPGCLQTLAGRELSEAEKDLERPQRIKEVLKKKGRKEQAP